MIPINIYALSRVKDEKQIQKFEKQMSFRSYSLIVKKWETQCLTELVEHLKAEGVLVKALQFYYSFKIPKLGKEFDLLRISDEFVLNVELKSGSVTDEKVKNQLIQNRYYLASLGKSIRSYTYISEEKRLLRLTNGNRLVESDFSELANDIEKQNDCYCGHIEELFKEDQFLLSPLTDPEHFLRREYFLTAQQKDIKNHILQSIKKCETLYYGFTGLPGTGKTLLLYDLAMELSEKQSVCMLHFGSYPQEMTRLNERLKRVDFYPCDGRMEFPDMTNYEAIFVDEGHRMTSTQLNRIEELANALRKPVIISYDCEDSISENERDGIDLAIEALEGFQTFRLTNRIRMNGELSTFIRNVMKKEKYHNKRAYRAVSVAYGNTMEETKELLQYYKGQGYIYIKDNRIDSGELEQQEIDTGFATCREFDRVVMVMDDSFYYDNENYLRSNSERKEKNDSYVRALFQGLSRGKKKIALVIMDNEAVFEYLLSVLQG